MRPLIVLSALVVVFGLLGACGTATGDTASASKANTSPAGFAGGEDSGEASTPSSEASPDIDGGGPRVAKQRQLTIFAAASLTRALTEIGRKFEAANNTTVVFSFAGSQQLAQQILQGAPADIFASANWRQMELVIADGQVVSGTQEIFARNRIVVIYPRDNPAQLTQLADLARTDVELVLAAKDVPAGQYSLDFLVKASQLPHYTSVYSEAVLANVVSYEESVKAVLRKVALGEADAGIVYSSDITDEAAANVGRINIPDELNTIASYPIAPIKDALNVALAQQFVMYMLAPEAQAILVKHGFLPAAE